LNKIVTAVGDSIFPLLNAFLILFMCTLVFAIIATHLFRTRRFFFCRFFFHPTFCLPATQRLPHSLYVHSSICDDCHPPISHPQVSLSLSLPLSLSLSLSLSHTHVHSNVCNHCHPPISHPQVSFFHTTFCIWKKPFGFFPSFLFVFCRRT